MPGHVLPPELLAMAALLGSKPCCLRAAARRALQAWRVLQPTRWVAYAVTALQDTAHIALGLCTVLEAARRATQQQTHRV